MQLIPQVLTEAWLAGAQPIQVAYQDAPEGTECLCLRRACGMHVEGWFLHEHFTVIAFDKHRNGVRQNLPSGKFAIENHKARREVGRYSLLDLVHPYPLLLMSTPRDILGIGYSAPHPPGVARA